MASPSNLRQHIELLEEQGKLYRFPYRINKDTELIPFYRVGLRGLPDAERKAILFDRVEGAQGQTFDWSVLVGCYGGSDAILKLGLGVATWHDALEHFHHAYEHPIAPVRVSEGPVQEVVLTGADIAARGMDIVPAPVEEVGFSGIIRTGLPMITRDPEAGVYNVGAYNAFFYDRDRLIGGIAPVRDAMRVHWRAALARGEDLPVAVVIGPSVQLMVAASSQIPYGKEGLDEFTLAGGLAGRPVGLVPCKTVPLEVPADTEAVIEGWLSTAGMEPIYSFGEYPGYMRTELNVAPTIRVTAITHRRDAIFTPVTVGFYPSDSNTLLGLARAGLIYRHLKYAHDLPVEEVYLPQEGSGIAICLIRMAEGASQDAVNAALRRATEVTHFKYCIAVDSDVRLDDPQQVFWALSYSTRPMADLIVERGGGGGILDPSLAPAGHGRGDMSPSTGIVDSRVLINATRKFAYPPLGLPRKQYMERAVHLWNECEGLPKVELKEPWYGYTLGFWPDELQEAADHIARGNYRAVGEMAARQRVAAAATNATSQEHLDALPASAM